MTWRREVLIVGVAAALAFGLAYGYSRAHPLSSQESARAFAQRLMTPAVNYACTGHFGPIRLTAEATPADAGAIGTLEAFLQMHTAKFSCAAFPRHVRPTWFFDGIDAANVEYPLHLTVLHAVLWRWFGVRWAVNDYVVAANVTLSFVLVYLCLRPFVPPGLAAALVLVFVSNPFFIAFTLNPRDATKFPFVVAIAAALVAAGTAVRRPAAFIAIAAGIGVLIGIGYGFRSDLFSLLPPALVIVAVLGRIELGPPTGARRALASLGLRGAAAGALVLGFGLGGFMPLVNDHVFHKHAGDVGYHPMAMGLLGHSRHDLFQRDGMIDGMYMYRNGFNNDLAVGVRIIEHAARRYGEAVPFAHGPYWTNAKRYYLSVVSYIPADLVSGAIGAFVNLMTVPRSLAERQTLRLTVDAAAPWATVYGFARNVAGGGTVLRGLDVIYRGAARVPVSLLFAANLLVFFAFLALVVERFGVRAAAAMLVLLAAVLAVTSLKFELRHMFYVYVFPLVAWSAVLWRGVRVLAVVGDREALAALGRSARGPLRAAGWLLAVAASAIIVLLLVARAYQVPVLRPLVADWAHRSRTPADVRTSEVRPGVTRIRVLSPLPLSSGGQRRPDQTVTPRVEMAVVAVDIDGRRCPGRQVAVTALGDSNLTDNSFWLIETLSAPGTPIEYVAYLPVFYYGHDGVRMHFAGIEVETRNLPCIERVSLIGEFKRDDVLFDFRIPKDLSYVRRRDLYQEVYLPGLGYW